MPSTEPALPAFRFVAPGAAADDIARGYAAAAAVFTAAGATPAQAAHAAFALEGVTVRLAGDPDAAMDMDIDVNLAAVWDEAATAAIQACGNPQPGWFLELQTADALAA